MICQECKKVLTNEEDAYGHDCEDFSVMGIKMNGDEYSFVNSQIVKIVNNNISEWNRRTSEERQDYIKRLVRTFRGSLI